MVPLSDNSRGALMMMAAMAGYACNDVLIKFTAQDIGLYQAILVRGAAATLLLGIVAVWNGALELPRSPRDRYLLVLRIITEIVITILFLTALLHVPLATVTAILQFTPLALTLVAALLLGESVGWRRYAAIAVGFVGVMLIVQPGNDSFNVYALYSLAAMCGVVIRDLLTRKMSRAVSSLFVAFSTAAAVTLMAAIVCLTQPWTPMAQSDVMWLMGAAVFILIGYLSSVTSMRNGDISFVSPFRYTVMVWAIILGWLVLGEVPEPIMLIGTALVTATGIYAIFRETRTTSA